MRKNSLFLKALAYSFPVFLGYVSIGIGFGLVLVGRSYPWWLAPVMCVLMYAGAGQYLAVGIFAAGSPLWEAALLQLVLNARHLAYGLSMTNRFYNTGRFKLYLIYSLTDETFALLSTMPPGKLSVPERNRLMISVALLDQAYWILGSLLGAVAGTFLPFDMTGIEFALTALFVVLMVEQFFKLKKIKPFALAALFTVLASVILPARFSLMSALVLSLGAVQIFDKMEKRKESC